MKFKVQDTIKVTAGKDRGKTGTIERIFPTTQTVYGQRCQPIQTPS